MCKKWNARHGSLASNWGLRPLKREKDKVPRLPDLTSRGSNTPSVPKGTVADIHMSCMYITYVPPHQGSGAGIAIKGDAWVSGWYPAATELNILKKAYSSQKKLVSF